MPTENRKRKSIKEEKKSVKEEKKSLLSIKREPDELKSLEHYVDDRIELIKQIFDSLKTKTIESIIPEFLQVSFYTIFSKIEGFSEISIFSIRKKHWKKFKRFVSKKFWAYPKNVYFLLLMQQNAPQTLSRLTLTWRKLKVSLVIMTFIMIY